MSNLLSHKSSSVYYCNNHLVITTISSLSVDMFVTTITCTIHTTASITLLYNNSMWLIVYMLAWISFHTIVCTLSGIAVVFDWHTVIHLKLTWTRNKISIASIMLIVRLYIWQQSCAVKCTWADTTADVFMWHFS